MGENSTRKWLAAIYRQGIIQDITLFTSQSAAVFYDKLFTVLDFTLPRAVTGWHGFLKEAMVCAFIVMKCEGFSQLTDQADYLDNNRLIAHSCGFKNLRFECERYNSRFKSSGQKRLWVRNGTSAANLNTLAPISALAAALAAVLSGSHSDRSAKLLRGVLFSGFDGPRCH